MSRNSSLTDQVQIKGCWAQQGTKYHMPGLMHMLIATKKREMRVYSNKY